MWLLVRGGQTAGGTAGGLMDSWANLGRAREREESEGMRDRRMLEAKVNDCVGGKRRRGQER